MIARLDRIDRRFSVLVWMVATNLTITLLVLGGQVALWTKLGEIAGRLH